MTYLDTPAESPLFPAELARLGYIPNYSRVFALAPEVYPAWTALGMAVKAGLSDRRYELVTLVAARSLGSRYCTLAHGVVLRDRFFDEETLRAIIADRHQAGLDPGDLAAMDLAELIAVDPRAVTDEAVSRCRRAGLSDVDILYVVLTVMARRFFAGTLHAVAAEPDPVFDSVSYAAAG